jgi:hypothetical protein
MVGSVVLASNLPKGLCILHSRGRSSIKLGPTRAGRGVPRISIGGYKGENTHNMWGLFFTEMIRGRYKGEISVISPFYNVHTDVSS